MPAPSHIEQRARETEEAYRLQVKGACEGAVRWTLYGIITTSLLHLRWPAFRRQTLAFKGFLVSSATIFGMVTWADHYLLDYERQRREEMAKYRRRAISELRAQGKVASETEIEEWKRSHVTKAD